MRGGTVGSSQVILVGGALSRLALGLLVSILLGRYLPERDLGFVSFLTTLFFLVRFVLDLGSGPLAAREIARDPTLEVELLGALRRFRGRVGFALGGLLAAYALFATEGFDRAALLGAAAVFPCLREGILMVPFQVRQSPWPVTLASLFVQFAYTAGIAAAVFAEAGGPVFAAAVIAREFLAVLPLPFLARRYFRLDVPARSSPRLRAFLVLARAQGLATLLQTSYFHEDVLLVRWLRGDDELGAYSAAFRPILPGIGLAGVVMAPLLPVLTQIADRNRHETASVIGSSVATMTALGLLAGVFGVTLAEDLIGLLYGGRFASGAFSAVGSFRALSWALAAAWIANVGTTALVALGREGRLVHLGLLGLLVNLVGNLVFLPVFGFEAAAWTTAATETAVLLGTLALTKGTLRFESRWVVEMAIPVCLFTGVCTLPLGDGPLVLGLRVAALGLAVAAVLASQAARRWRRLEPTPR